MSLTIHEHPFASYCWKTLIALYELELPFERVITAHGEPLHDRAAFEQALERPAWRE